MVDALKSSFQQGILALGAAALLFMLFEPAIGNGAVTATSQFIVSQVISNELAFSTPPSNVLLSPSIGGLTGGTANGGTQFIISSSDSLGFLVTLTSSSSVGMIGNASSSNSIPAYVPAVPNVPDFSFTVPANKAAFGYTVESSTTSDLAPIFLDNGAACDTGSSDTHDACWLNASTTAVTIINRPFRTSSSGATSTLKFRVTINPNPIPTIPDDTYVSTSTLTATAN